jgi:hypothetical protein
MASLMTISKTTSQVLIKISLSDVNDVIKKHFDTENMKVLVYSSKEQVMSQLQDISEVNVMPYKKALN